MSDGAATRDDPGRRVTVRGSTCEGTGYCVQLCPEVFTIGADGKAAVDQKAARRAAIADLTEAETMCPTSAIQVRQHDQD